MSMIDRFERMILDGKNSALLRFGLGNEYTRVGRHAEAVKHLDEAVRLDPGYSAAWKILGKAHEARGDYVNARDAWDKGIRAADSKGDKQAAKEMQVFLKRLDKRAAG